MQPENRRLLGQKVSGAESQSKIFVSTNDRLFERYLHHVGHFAVDGQLDSNYTAPGERPRKGADIHLIEADEAAGRSEECYRGGETADHSGDHRILRAKAQPAAVEDEKDLIAFRTEIDRLQHEFTLRRIKTRDRFVGQGAIAEAHDIGRRRVFTVGIGREKPGRKIGNPESGERNALIAATNDRRRRSGRDSRRNLKVDLPLGDKK